MLLRCHAAQIQNKKRTADRSGWRKMASTYVKRSAAIGRFQLEKLIRRRSPRMGWTRPNWELEARGSERIKDEDKGNEMDD